MAALDAKNIAEGKCTACGGSRVVAAMREIDRTGNPYANQRCRRCGGSGKPKTASDEQAEGQQ
jgi:DnaJ-class molecular chaperone